MAAAFAHAELDPAVADQVQGRHALGDAGRMIGGQLNDAVTETNILRALAGGTQEYFRRRAVGIFLKEMMLNHPGVVDAEPVRQFHLIERVLEQLLFRTRFPGTGQLQFVENTEFHGRLSLTAAEHAAIDDQLVAVDIPGLVRRQIERRIGHILDLAETPQRHGLRSLLGRFVPREKETEFFGFFAFSGKAIAFMGPLLLGIVTEAFQSQRAGMATILIFFVLGGLLLTTVDEAEGLASASS